MTTSIRCLTYAIGLSQSECECLDYPELASRSDSGLYLDELEPLSSIIMDQRGDCEKGNLQTLMERAREQAVISFEADFMREVLKTNKLKRRVFDGEVGRRVWENELNISGAYAALRMPVCDVVSGTAKISYFGAMFGNTGTFNLMIYNSLNELIDTVPITTVANQYSRTVVDITLPLHRDGVENLEYYFVYDLAGQTPLDNELNCRNCDCLYSFDLKRPYWTMTPLQDGWENWSMFQPCTLESLDFMCLDTCTYGLYSMLGLTLGIKFSCNITETICKGDGDTTGIDFDSDVDGLQIAQAIRLKAGSILIKMILGAPEINRYTLINRETLIKAKMSFVEKYEIILQEMASEIDVNKFNDCLECKDDNDFKKVTIYS